MNRNLFLSSCLLLAAAACGGGGGGASAPAPGFTLAVSPASATLLAGQSGTATVTATRTNGQTGAITLALVSPPAGLTGGGVIPDGADSALLTLTAASAGVVPGNYTLTVQGASGSLDGTATLALDLEAPTVCTWVFSATAGPSWFAYQDGSGPWVPVAGASGSYGFTLLQGTGAVAYVLTDASGASSVVLDYGAYADLASANLVPTQGDNLTVSGTYADLTATQGANLTLGFLGSTYADGALATSGPWAMNYLDAGVQDLLGVVVDAAGTPSHLVIHRNVDVQASGSLGTPGDLAFTAEGADLAPETLTVTGAGPATGELLKVWQTFTTSQGTAFLTGAYLNGTLATAVYGVPASLRSAGDVDIYAVEIGPDDGTGYIATTSNRTVWAYGLAPGDPAVASPEALTAPTAAVAATQPYVLITAPWAFPAPFNGPFSATYTQGAQSAWTVNVQPGYGPFNLTFPDFSALAGWQSAWGLVPGTPVTAVFQGSGQTWTTWPPPAGARTNQAVQSQTLDP